MCWLLFVRACCILRKRIVTEDEVSTADLGLGHSAENLSNYMVKRIALPTCTCIYIKRNVFLITGLHILSGASPLNDTTGS